MKNYLLLLLVSTVVLNSCQKEDEPKTVDLLSTPLDSTPYGFVAKVNGTLFYYNDSLITYTFGSNGNYHFQSVIGNDNLSMILGVNLYSLRTNHDGATDSEFYDYLKLGNYNYININTSNPTNQNVYYVTVLSNLATPTSTYGSESGVNPDNSYFTILDTLHTTYRDSAAVKFRAKFSCSLYNQFESDSVIVKEGIFVGLIVKP